uniref:Stage V sporulation protein B n=1 Tax=uncultured organism TaxID=155900 RepID=M1P287_9ZZZZ|nr:stage V sporulation protein B [uncultured organism]
MTDNKGKNFIKGAVILTAAGLIARVMGFVYRVILTRIIGAEGMGLYQMAYPIYTILLVVSRSGIPVALAKLISDRIAKEKRKEAFNIFKVARFLSIGIGLFFSLVMAFSARPLISLLGLDPRAYYAVLAISPAIFFVSIMATYRGFFQGLQTMVPTAFSQIIEQLIRMITMIALVFFLVKYGLKFAAAGASFGAVTGAIAGLLTLIFIYYKRKNKIWSYINTGEDSKSNVFEIIKEIAVLGVPITIGALVQPLMNLVDLIFVPQRLQVAGFLMKEATTLYGRLSAVAMPLVNFPTIITVSLAASLVPSISEAFALEENDLIKLRTQTALRLTILIALPSSVGLFVLAREITQVVFSEPAAAVPLRFVAWGVTFIALQQTSSAILQGIGKTAIPARNLFIGAISNGIINYTLTALPRFGIKGAAIGTAVGFAVAAFLNLYYVKKYTHFEVKFDVLIWKPLFSVLIMGISTIQGFKFFQALFTELIPEYSYTVSTFAVVLMAALIYGLILLLLNEIKYSDIILIPRVGKKLADTLQKLGLVGEK